MTTGSIFDNLEAIRLSPDAAATAGTREVLRHVPIRKPNRTEFIRVHPDADMQIATGVFIDRDERGVLMDRMLTHVFRLPPATFPHPKRRRTC